MRRQFPYEPVIHLRASERQRKSGASERRTHFSSKVHSNQVLLTLKLPPLPPSSHQDSQPALPHQPLPLPTAQKKTYLEQPRLAILDQMPIPRPRALPMVRPHPHRPPPRPLHLQRRPADRFARVMDGRSGGATEWRRVAEKPRWVGGWWKGGEREVGVEGSVGLEGWEIAGLEREGVRP